MDVTIEADGRVSDVVVRESVNTAYNAMVVAAAKYWHYKPAMKDGVPVRFVKSIVLSVTEE